MGQFGLEHRFLRFRRLRKRDVPHRGRGADDAPGSVTNRRRRKRNQYLASVLAAAHGFEIRHAMPHRHFLGEFFLFPDAVGRKQEGDAPADRILPRVPEQSFGRWIIEMNDAGRVRHDDGVDRGIDQCREELLAPQELAAVG